MTENTPPDQPHSNASTTKHEPITNSANNSTGMYVTEQTKSFKSLMPYALLYLLAYVLLPIGFLQWGLPLGGLFLFGFTLIVINIPFLVLFYKTQNRWLEKIECSRIGIIVSLLKALLYLAMVTTYSRSILPVDFDLMKTHGIGASLFLIVPFIVNFLFHYAVVCYGLWFMQKPIVSKLKQHKVFK